MVSKLVEAPSMRLLKHLVRCYLRLSENARAREALRECLPDALKGQAFASVLKNEEAVQRWLTTLLKNISEGVVANPEITHTDPSQNLSFMTAATSALSLTDNTTNGIYTSESGSSSLTIAGGPVWGK